MTDEKKNAVRRGWDTITVDAMIKVGIPLLGAIVIGAMAWQSFADDIDDLEDAGSVRHRRISTVEDKQEEYNEKLHEIDKKFLTTTNNIENITDDVEEIQNDIEAIRDAVAPR